MKYALSVTYLFSIYAWMPLLNLFNTSEGETSLPIRILYAIAFCLPVICGIGNCVYAGRLRKANNDKELLTNAVMIKYGMIPFFAYGAGMVLALALASIVPIMWIFGVPLLLPLFVSVGYLLMVLGSGYSIAYAREKMKTNPSARAGYLLGIIASFIFVFDVIVVMIFSWREKRFKPMTIAIIVIFALAFLALLALTRYVFLSAISG